MLFFSSIADAFLHWAFFQVMQQMLNGLYYIHSNKIIHRDMKAANVLITKQVCDALFSLSLMGHCYDHNFRQFRRKNGVFLQKLMLL
jgi:serine/threonine protein kinase